MRCDDVKPAFFCQEDNLAVEDFAYGGKIARRQKRRKTILQEFGNVFGSPRA
jgi:hypothetical protein